MARTSSKQQEIMDFVSSFMSTNGYAPTVREIGQAVGLRSTATVSYHLAQLQQKGMLSYAANKKRAITAPVLRPGQIPILGVVTAGLPILATENQEGTLTWDGDPTCFALRIRGDSMINAGIMDGDLVVVRPQATAEDGEIVVALLDDEATVKRFRCQRGEIWLQPENPNYAPIYSEQLQVIGLVKAVIRYYL